MTTETLPSRRAEDAGLPARGLTPGQVDLLRRTVAPDLSDDELALFLEVAKRKGLDPFQRQIHAVARGRGDDRRMAIQTGIDGLRLIADRSGLYSGNSEPQFEGQVKIGDILAPASASVTVYKIVRGENRAFSATVRWHEYYPGDGKSGFFWRKMPHGMLGKCAEAAALRKALPAELGGIYERSELDQAAVSDEQPPPRKTIESRPIPPRADVEVQAALTNLIEDYKRVHAGKTFGDFIVWAGGILKAEPDTLRKPSAWSMEQVRACADFAHEEEDIPF